MWVEISLGTLAPLRQGGLQKGAMHQNEGAGGVTGKWGLLLSNRPHFMGAKGGLSLHLMDGNQDAQGEPEGGNEEGLYSRHEKTGTRPLEDTLVQ